LGGKKAHQERAWFKTYFGPFIIRTILTENQRILINFRIIFWLVGNGIWAYWPIKKEVGGQG